MATGAYDNYWTRKQRELEAANKKLRAARGKCPIPTSSGDPCKAKVTKTGLCGLHQFYKDEADKATAVTDENVS